MFYHALTGNGGDTPEPIVDNRTFIIKDGVVQNGFEMKTNEATTTYDSGLGMLKVHFTGTNVAAIYFIVDLTNYNKICRLTKNLTDGNGSWNTSARYTVISDAVLNATDMSSLSNKLDAEFANVEALNGNKYINIVSYAGNSNGDYDYYIKDLWLE